VAGLQTAQLGIQQGLYMVMPALACVELVAPIDVQKPAGQIGKCITDANTLLRNYVPADASKLDEIVNSLNKNCGDFTTVARRDLGVD
jgi:hypothetical protein